MSVGALMRTGVRIGVDVGTVRVGVAATDATATLASPVAVVRRDVRGDADLDRIRTVVVEREAIEVVVGLPRLLRGGEGVAAASARDYAVRLARRVAPVPVRLVDERLTTVEAARALRDTGKDARRARDIVDAAAAVVLLQAAVDTERSTGAPPGELLNAESTHE